MSKKTQDEKETKKIVKKEKKVKKSKEKKKKETKNSLFSEIKSELKKVRWPLKKEMVKYSMATLGFIIFFAAFFAVGDLLIAAVKVLVA